MSTPTVTNTVKRPSGVAATDAIVSIELAGDNGKRIAGYVTASDYTIEGLYKPAVNSSTGVWSQALVPNSLITPAGSRYKVIERVDGRAHEYFILVTDVAGPLFVEDILDEAPGALPSTALAAHLADTVDAHDASAVSFDPTDGIVATTVQAAVEEIDDRVDTLELGLRSGTWAEMQAVASPSIGDRFICTDQFDEEYLFNDFLGMWKLARLTPTQYAPIEFGADPTGAADSRQAFINCFDAVAAVFATGIPAGDGNLRGGEAIITTGAYIISSTITLPDMAGMKITGESGGQGGAFMTSPSISFTTGGFYKAFGGSLNPFVKNLFIYGAPAFKCGPNPYGDEGGPGWFENVYFRAADGYAGGAVEINNAFYATFIGCGFRGASGAGVYINVGNPQSFALGWMYRFLFCQFDLGTDAILWETDGISPPSMGIGCMFQHCLTENLYADAAFLHIRNVHATNSHSFWPMTIDTVDMADSAGNPAVVHLESVGTGELVLQGLSVKHCSGMNNLVRTTGPAYPNRFVYEGISGGTPLDFDTTHGGGFGAMQLGDGSAWEYTGFTNAAVSNTSAYRAGFHDDAYPYRWIKLARGWEQLGLGTGAPTMVRAHGNGSPEGVVTSSPGGTYNRMDGGAGTSFYVKESGTGNTGWVAK